MLTNGCWSGGNCQGFLGFVFCLFMIHWWFVTGDPACPVGISPMPRQERKACVIWEHHVKRSKFAYSHGRAELLDI